MKIEQLMSQPAVTCSADDSLNTAAQVMWEGDFGAVPVVDEHGALVGILTDRDVCMAAYTRGALLCDLRVRDAMAKKVYACYAGDPLEAAQQLMAEKQIRRVPVVDDAYRPIGMLSMNDLVRFAALTRKKSALEHEVTQALAAICQPRSVAMQVAAAIPLQEPAQAGSP